MAANRKRTNPPPRSRLASLQSEYGKLVLRADVDLAICDCGNRKFDGRTRGERVVRTRRTGVQFRQIRGPIRTKDRRLRRNS
jgi:hypothetical protein